VKRLLGLITLACAAVAAGAAPAGATNECRGLMVCVRVVGPWVVVPSRGAAPRPQVEFQLSCPRRYLVGGLDAELSNPAIDVSFAGKLGSPVAPGVTTSRKAVFVATYVGSSRRAVTFRPHLGCVPANGAGGGIPTYAATPAAVPPGQPTARRVRTLRVTPGRPRAVAVGCKSAERLVGGSHAVGFYTGRAPAARLVTAVATRQALGRDHVTVQVRSGFALGRVRAIVQVSAICAGGK
jgi:hypothetical protein